MATSTTPAKKTEKSARRTPAQIAQDELNATLEKLEAARARLERAEAAKASAEINIERLTAQADWQSSHPALQQAEAESVEDEDQNEAVIGAI